MRENSALQTLVGRVADRLSFRHDASDFVARNPRPLVLEALEPRVLFSGAPVASPAPAPAAAPVAQAAPSPAEAAPLVEAAPEVAVAAPPEASAEVEAPAATVTVSDSGAEAGVTAIVLTDAEVTLLSQAASSIWSATNISEDQRAALASATYRIADLSGLGANILASTEGNIITIDDDAAGRGWFVDSTPDDNSEFVLGASGPATIHIDLLSVLLHEQGHLLGLEGHGTSAGNIMFEVIGKGERRLPGVDEAAGALPGSLEGSHLLTFGPSTETFEDEPARGAKTFSQAGGPTFTLTGDFQVEIEPGFGNGSPADKFVDTVYNNGGSSGVVGSITIQSGYSFQIHSLDIALTNDDGLANPNGGGAGVSQQITIRGTRQGGGADVVITPTINSTADYVTLNAAGVLSPFVGVKLSSLTFEFPGGSAANFIYLDNFNYTAETVGGGGGGGGVGPIAGVDFEDAANTGWDRAPDDLNPSDGITVSADWTLLVSGNLRNDAGANGAGASGGNFPGRLQSDGSWSITIPDTIVLNLSHITFDVRGATGSTGTPSGRSGTFGTSLDGGLDATPLWFDPNLLGRPTWTPITVDLSAPLYQNLTNTTVTFFWNGTSAIDIDTIVLYGASAPVTTGPDTTMTGTASGSNGEARNSWNNPANWDNGVPSGTNSAAVADGILADVWNSANDTPTYSGGLTLGVNSTLLIGYTTHYTTDINALGTGTVTMNQGSSILLRKPATVTLPEITLAGNGSIDLSPSTSAHNQIRNFGKINGPGTLTIIGNNGNTANFNTASTNDGFIGDAADRWRIKANVAGALGLGDVTINRRTSDARSAELTIAAANVIADTATLTLNGGGYAGDGANLIIMNANDTVNKLFVNGVQMAAGAYTNASGTWISGTGTLTVLTGPPATAPTLASSDIVDDVYGGPIYQDFGTVTYTLTFSSDMDASTVSAADFSNAGTATVTIGAVTETTAPLFPSVFTVEVTPTSPGTLRLQVNAGADLRDTSGTPLDTSSAILDDTTITINPGNMPTATITGTSGGADSWNVASNWDTNTIPFGPGSAIVGGGVLAQVSNASTPAYAGTLTLEANSTLRINSANSIGVLQTPSNITLKSGATIDILDGSPTFGDIELAGDASLTARGNNAHHETFNFSGVISGVGALTLDGVNNDTFNINQANSFQGGLVVLSSVPQTFRVKANATGSLGMGDVTIGDLVSFHINAANVIHDSATLYVNGGAANAHADNGKKLIVNFNDTIGGFFIDGVNQGFGTFGGIGSGAGTELAIITGSGILNVVAPVVVTLDAVDDNYTTDEDTVLTISAPGVLANDIGANQSGGSFGTGTLKIHYSFDDGTFGTATNSVGTDGTITGNSVYAGGVVGSGALSFDGVDDYINTVIDLGTTNQYTMSFWYKTAVAQGCCGSGALYYTNGAWGAVGDEVHSSLTSGSSAIWNEIHLGSQRSSGSVTTALNTWNHMVASFDNGNITFTVNGAQNPVGTQTMSGALARLGTGQIGAWNGTRDYNGLFDDWAIWTGALNAAESTAVYNLAKSSLNYNAQNADELFAVFDGTQPSASIGGKTWVAVSNGTLTGSPGQVVDLGGGNFGLILNGLGGGVSTTATPTGTATIIAFDAISAGGATVNVNPDGSFTYDPTGSVTIRALNDGEMLVDTFTYTIANGAGTATTIAASGWNVDFVLGNGETYGAHSKPENTNIWFADNSTVGSLGLPASGAVTVSGIDFQLNPFTGGTNNVLRSTAATNRLTLDSPDKFSTISLLGSNTGGTAGANWQLVLNFSDGPSSGAITYSAFGNWAGSGTGLNPQLTSNGTSAAFGGQLNTHTLDLAALGFSGLTLQSIDFSNANGASGNLAIFGLSGVTTPPTDTATVSIKVNGVNDLDAVDDVYTTDEDAVLTISAPGILANDTPTGAKIIDFDLVSAGGATVRVNPDGSFSYDPTGSVTIQALKVGDILTDTFTYTITDSVGVGTGPLDWNFSNDSLNGWTVLKGVANFSGNGISASQSNGNFAHDAAHETFLVESPDFRFDGTTLDGTNALIIDFDGGQGNQGGSVATFANPGEVFAFNGGNSASNGLKAIALYNTVTGQYDATLFDPGNGGGIQTAVLSAAAVSTGVTYRLHFYDNDEGSWGWTRLNRARVAGGEPVFGTTDTATVTITVSGVNDAPVAADDRGAVTESADAILNPTATGNVLSNDTDVDNTAGELSVTQVNGSAGSVGNSVAGTYGSIVINSGGGYTYTLDDANPATQALKAGQKVAETFVYTVSDGPPIPPNQTLRTAGVAIGNLLGGDLTDPENDGIDGPGNGTNYNAIFSASSEQNFGGFTGPTGNSGAEAAFDVFDNIKGGGNAKWCCGGAPQWVAAQLPSPKVLTHFTISSSNDSPGRDPDVWEIQGSNDGTNWESIFVYNRDGVNPFTARNQTLLYTSTAAPSAVAAMDTNGADFETYTAYSRFRYLVTSTGGANHALGELEFFGVDPFPTPGQDTATVTITITGVNDAPVATDNTASVTEDGPTSDSGNVITDDDGFGADYDVDSTFSVTDVNGTAIGTNTTITGTHGTLVMSGDGSYTYNLDNAAAQALAGGEVVFETFTYTVNDGEMAAPVARFVQIIESTPNTFHLSELEVFEAGVVPNNAGSGNFGGLRTSTNDIAGGVPYNIGNVFPAVGTTASIQHGNVNNQTNNVLESGGAVWSTNLGGQNSQFTLDLGSEFSIDRVRAWPRADTCCTERWDALTINLYADDGTGKPGALVSTINIVDPNANTPHDIVIAPINVSKTSTATLTVTVNGVNDAPVLDPGGVANLGAVSVSDFSNDGDSVEDILNGATTDVDNGALDRGIAITGVTVDAPGTGRFQYMTGGGMWTDIPAVSGDGALLLLPTDRVRFVPDGTNFSGGSITYRAWDRTSGTAGALGDADPNGGTTAFSEAAATSRVAVANVVIDGGEIIYTAGAGQANDIRVSMVGGMLVIIDANGHSVSTGEADGNPDANGISIAYNGENLRILTGDMNDSITFGVMDGFTGSLTADGGTDFDTITTEGSVLKLGVDKNMDLDAERVRLLNSTISTTGTGTFTIDGTGGGSAAVLGIYEGVKVKGTSLTTEHGNITVNGTGGADATANEGVQLSAGSSIMATGTGNVTVGGQGGTGGSSNTGVSIIEGSTVSSGAAGGVTVTGTGGGERDSRGVNLLHGSTVSGGSGGATVTGTATGTGVRNDGVYTTTSRISASDGGSVVVTGTASQSAASGANAIGVRISSGTTVDVAGGGSITLTGTGGTGTSGNEGVHIGQNSALGTEAGDITITGTSSATGANNYGVNFLGGSSAASGGALTIAGTGGNGSYGNAGVGLANAVLSATGGGAVSVTGIGQGTGAGYNNVGIIGSGSSIASLGGNLTVSGTGGAGTTGNQGVRLTGGSITTTGGNIDIDALGAGTGAGNSGVRLTNVLVESTGAGNVAIDGTGGAGTANNVGIELLTNARVFTSTGTITLTGTGAGSSYGNRGIVLANSRVQSTNEGTVTLIGTATSAAPSGYFNDGISLTSSHAGSSGGTLRMQGFGGSGSNANNGIKISGGSLSGNLDLDGTALAGTTGSGNAGVTIQGTDFAAVTGGSIDGVGGGGTGSNHGVSLNGILGITTEGAFPGTVAGTAGGGASSMDKVGNFFNFLPALLAAAAAEKRGRKEVLGGLMKRISKNSGFLEETAGVQIYREKDGLLGLDPTLASLETLEEAGIEIPAAPESTLTAILLTGDDHEALVGFVAFVDADGDLVDSETLKAPVGLTAAALLAQLRGEDQPHWSSPGSDGLRRPSLSEVFGL